MSDIFLDATILVENAQGTIALKRTLSSTTRIEAHIKELLVLLDIADEPSGWELVWQGVALAHEATLGSRATRGQVEKPVLRLRRAPARKPNQSDLKWVDLTCVTIPSTIIAMVPASVSRENVILPFAEENGMLLIAMSDPADYEVIQKLKIILNREIQPVLAPKEQIVDAIDRHYGQGEPASVDSCLTEFTDTQIDFTEAQHSARAEEGSELELSLSDSGEIPLVEADEEVAEEQVVALDEEEFADEAGAVVHDKDAIALPRSTGAAKPKASARAASRRATVRYYNRMNPERLHPLLVMITRDMVEKLARSDVGQKSTGPFKVKLDAPVEIEPVLPGCVCYPPKLVTRLGKEDYVGKFYVVPHVLGTIEGATVVIRQDDIPLAEIPLEAKVVRRTWVIICGILTFCLPMLSALAKHFRIDFHSQQEVGFNLYVTMAEWALTYSSPVGLTVGLASLTLLLYWLSRARTKDVFWEIKTVGPHQGLQEGLAVAEMDPARASADLLKVARSHPDFQPAHLAGAMLHYRRKDYAKSLLDYEKAFRLGKARPRDYLRASLAATHLGRTRTALSILQQAETALGPTKLPGVLLYNMACYHIRLGDHDQAITHLHRALHAGYRKKKSYLHDHDLDPLRTRAAFQQVLAKLG